MTTVLAGCGGGGDSGDDDDPDPEPFIQAFSADHGSVPFNGDTTLRWATIGMTTCTASGAWSGQLPTNGSRFVGPLTSTATFHLSCVGGSDDDDGTLTVQVAPPASPELIDFSFVYETGRLEHTGLAHVEGEPVSGETLEYVAIFSSLLQSLSVSVRTEGGVEIAQASAPMEFGSSTSFTQVLGSLQVPDRPFRVVFGGTDIWGFAQNVVTERVFSPQFIDIRFLRPVDDIVVGQSTEVKLSLRNAGAAADVTYFCLADRGVELVPREGTLAVGADPVEVRLAVGVSDVTTLQTDSVLIRCFAFLASDTRAATNIDVLEFFVVDDQGFPVSQ